MKKTAETPKTTVRVATYNVHQFVGTDSVRSVERTAQAILRLDADIIGLQEVDSEPEGASRVEYLRRLTGFQAVFGPTFRRRYGDYGNMLLSRFPIQNHSSIDLSYKRREPRGAILGDIQVQDTPLRVIVTHLGLSRRERNWQVDRLLRELPREAPGPEVFLADANEWWPFARSLRKLNRRFGKAAHFRTFHSRCALLPLDKIWVNPRELLEKAHIGNSMEFRSASDHLPLVGILRLERP